MVGNLAATAAAGRRAEPGDSECGYALGRWSATPESAELSTWSVSLFAISLRSGQFGLGQSPQDKSPVPAVYQNETETEDIEQ